MLGIQDLLERYPHGLSGGEIQRVALGRALSSGPSILCLDEPLSALDDETHSEICSLLDSVKQQTGVTILHITHRKYEMRRLADRLLVIEDGVVEEEELNDDASAKDGLVP
jgi:ABC-type molybdate transport system ATPase subunit